MAAQYNNQSGSIQSGGGPVFTGVIFNTQINSMSSDISNEDRMIQYVACIGWPFLRSKQVVSLLICKQVLLYRSLLGCHQRLAEFLLGVKPF